MTSNREHWQSVYETKAPTEVSWYTEHLDESLRLIRSVADSEARIIDVGAGASTLVDDLLASGFRRLTALDISTAALDVARRRLGDRSSRVTWIAADVTTVDFNDSAFDVWHDRAVFHFLTDESDRNAYVEQVRRAVAPGGHAVIGTFSLAGPSRCSGLDVVRYDSASLARIFGPGFELSRSLEASHLTPTGREQSFQFCLLQRGSHGAD